MNSEDLIFLLPVETLLQKVCGPGGPGGVFPNHLRKEYIRTDFGMNGLVAIIPTALFVVIVFLWLISNTAHCGIVEYTELIAARYFGSHSNDVFPYLKVTLAEGGT